MFTARNAHNDVRVLGCLCVCIRLPVNELRDMASSTIQLVLLWDEAVVAEDLRSAEHVASITEIADACLRCCNAFFKDCLLAGFAAVQIAATQWTELVVQPLRLAAALGLHALETPLSSQFPHALFSKPLLASQDYVASMHAYIEQGECT